MEMKNEGAKPGTPAVRLLGVVLGLAGGLLDFYSGYQIVVQNPMTYVMGHPASYSSTGMVWGAGLVALGVVLVATSLAALSPRGVRMMKEFGELMIVYGVAMLFVAASMYYGVAPMMGGALASAIAMAAVGLLMLGNGFQMARSRM